MVPLVFRTCENLTFVVVATITIQSKNENATTANDKVCLKTNSYNLNWSAIALYVYACRNLKIASALHDAFLNVLSMDFYYIVWIINSAFLLLLVLAMPQVNMKGVWLWIIITFSPKATTIFSFHWDMLFVFWKRIHECHKTFPKVGLSRQ